MQYACVHVHSILARFLCSVWIEESCLASLLVHVDKFTIIVPSNLLPQSLTKSSISPFPSPSLPTLFLSFSFCYFCSAALSVLALHFFVISFIVMEKIIAVLKKAKNDQSRQEVENQVCTRLHYMRMWITCIVICFFVVKYFLAWKTHENYFHE